MDVINGTELQSTAVAETITDKHTEDTGHTYVCVGFM